MESTDVRRMTPSDIPSVVKLHRRLFHDTLALLGDSVLGEFYRANLNEIALVASVDGSVVGYHLTVAGGRPSITRLLSKGGFGTVIGALPRIFADWRLLPRMVRAVIRRMPLHGPSRALSLYTAVAPEAQGRGLARRLLRRMVVEAAERGLETIEGEHEDDPRLHGLYESVGFRVRYDEAHGSAKLPAVMNVQEAVRLLPSP